MTAPGRSPADSANGAPSIYRQIREYMSTLWGNAMNRRERRAAKAKVRSKASLTCGTVADLDDISVYATMSLDDMFDNFKARVRKVFERHGSVGTPTFICIGENGDVFDVAAAWDGAEQKAAVYGALRDAFMKRRVIRYVFASEVWIGTPGTSATDDPNRQEGVSVIIVDRNGARKHAVAAIVRNGVESPTLSGWEDYPEQQGWLYELIDDAVSDAPPKEEGHCIQRFVHARTEFDQLAADDPDLIAQTAEIPALVNRFWNVCGDLRLDSNNQVTTSSAILMVMTGMIDEFGGPVLLRSVAEIVRQSPDKLPMFGSVESPQQPTEAERRRVHNALWKEALRKDNASNVMISAVVTILVRVGTDLMGSIRLAEMLTYCAETIEAPTRSA
jgi:hypothetical protein